jgi:hypothetical protein
MLLEDKCASESPAMKLHASSPPSRLRRSTETTTRSYNRARKSCYYVSCQTSRIVVPVTFIEKKMLMTQQTTSTFTITPMVTQQDPLANLLLWLFALIHMPDRSARHHDRERGFK